MQELSASFLLLSKENEEPLSEVRFFVRIERVICRRYVKAKLALQNVPHGTRKNVLCIKI
jgi:hypothetical protein